MLPVRNLSLTILSLTFFVSQTLADEFYKLQWGIKNTGENQSIELDHITTFKVQGRTNQDLQIPASLKRTNKKILVAVLDTGIDFNHPDLKNIIHRNESECLALEKFEACLKDKDRGVCEKTWMDLKNPEVDQDHNGYPLDCHGWSILGSTNAADIMGRPDFTDDQGHGTHVAGIIAAEKGNQLGVEGVSSNIEILPVQVLGKKPSEPIKPLDISSSANSGTELTPVETGKEAYRKNLGDLVARGVIYAIRSGAQVINFSMGWPEGVDSAFLRQVIAEAQSKGIIIVAAAGNDSTRALLRPCAYPGVICVAAHGPDGSLSHFSNYGTGVDIAAPGTNILSTWPIDKRPVRFRSTFDYEYLHGTSQASPMVAGLVAEMLAQGIPANEIYPRLILGSRPILSKLPLLEGSAQDLKNDKIPELSQVEKKWILAGLADLSGALKVKPQGLVLPASKEKKEIQWDRKTDVLQLSFPMKNIWKDLDFTGVSISADWVKPNSKAIRPEISKIEFDNLNTIWKSGEVRNLLVSLKINDSATAAKSRISSELDLSVQLKIADNQFRFILESEITIPVKNTFSDEETETIPLVNMPQQRTTLVSIDENLDQVKRTDYLAIAGQNQSNLYYLLKQNSSGSLEPAGQFLVNLGEDQERSREQITARLDWNLKSSGYVLGLLIDRSDVEDENVYSSFKIFFLDEKFSKQKTFEISNKFVQMPTKVSWQSLKDMKTPAWVGKGLDPYKKPSVRDDWENPDQQEKPQTRFYYLDEQGKLQALSKYQDPAVANGSNNIYRFIDVLDASAEQIKAGRVPVILAKNRGTEIKPSYIYDFAIAEVINGKVENFKSLQSSMDQSIYHNLLDTRVDSVLSLNSDNLSATNSSGTFWFGEGAARTQRLSMLLPGNSSSSSLGSFQFFESSLTAARGKIDSTLWVRAAFAGSNSGASGGKASLGAFALTNSEIQYHDLYKKQIAVKSYERYTFYPDLVISNLHFPIALKNQDANAPMVPALFVTESTGLYRGIKFKAAAYDERGDLIEITTPARLRFKSDKGCRPLDNPTVASDGTPALDYYCGNKILRMKLAY